MRLGPTSKAALAALALVDAAFATDVEWKPITFTLDPITPMFTWATDWKSAFGGETQPSFGKVGWGTSQRILDAASLPPAANLSEQVLVADPFSGSELRVYGWLSPQPTDNTGAFTGLADGGTSGVDVPGSNSSAISFELPINTTSAQIVVRPAGTQGIYTIDQIGFTTRIATNFSSVEQIPQSTEFFVENGALNPRLQWNNASTEGTAKWRVQKGLSDITLTSAGAPTAASATATSAPSASPSKDSGPEDYWQAISTNAAVECKVEIPGGTSFIIINGSTGPDRSFLAADLSPTPPFSASARTSSNLPDYAMFRTPNNSWAADAVLFMRELDPAVKYTLSLRPELSQRFGQKIGIHSITYYYGLDDGEQPPPPPLSAKSNTAAIAGGVVGGVVGGLLIALIALYFCVWRPRKRKEHEEAERDANIENSRFTPFVQPALDSEAQPHNVVPPSYNPAWAAHFPREPAPARNMSESGSPLLGTVNESAPDWKRPYLPESHGGAPLGTSPTTPVTPPRRGLFGKRSPQRSPRQLSEKASAATYSEKGGQAPQQGYTESMLRAVNSDP